MPNGEILTPFQSYTLESDNWNGALTDDSGGKLWRTSLQAVIANEGLEQLQKRSKNTDA